MYPFEFQTYIQICNYPVFHSSFVFSLLWETLTGREHLFFYGRLKNLKGSALKQVSVIHKDEITKNLSN